MNYLILIIIIASFNDVKSVVTLKKKQTTTKKNENILKKCHDFKIAYDNNMQNNPKVLNEKGCSTYCTASRYFDKV